MHRRIATSWISKIAAKPWLRGLAIGTACAAVACALSIVPFMQTFDDWLFDGCVSWRGMRDSESDEKIVIVGLDEDSFEQLGVPVQYISPKLAQVVKFINDHQARAIGIDMLIPDYASSFPGIAPAQPQSEPAGEAPPAPLGDMQPLRDAVHEKGNVVLIQRLNGPNVIRPLAGWWFTPEYGAEKLACVELTEDRDFVARRQRLIYNVPAAGDRSSVLRCRHLTVALLELVRNQPSELEDGPSPRLAGEPVPLDGDGLLAINFVGPPRTFRQIPFWKVQSQAETGGKVLSVAELDALRDAVVIIGITTRLDGDRHLSPFVNNLFGLRLDPARGFMDGPELHANILATLWDRQFIRTLTPLVGAGIIWLTGVLLQVALARLGAWSGTLLFVVHHFGWKFVAVAALDWWNLRLNLSGVLLSGALTSATVIFLQWRSTRTLPLTSRRLSEQRVASVAVGDQEPSQDGKPAGAALESALGKEPNAYGVSDSNGRPFDVFISYSAQDKLAADAVCRKLEGDGIRCWIAPRDIVPGREWGEAIIDGIGRSRVMVLIFSAHANGSPQVRREVERAINRQLALIPFRVERILPTGAMEYCLSNTHWLDAFDPPLERHVEQLSSIVRQLIRDAPAPSAPTKGRDAAAGHSDAAHEHEESPR